MNQQRSEQELVQIAHSGDLSSQLSLFDGGQLPEAVYRELLEQANHQVLLLIATDTETPTQLLEQMLYTFPSLWEQIAQNPSAPVLVQLTSPVAALSNSGVNRFLERIGATDEQRVAFRTLYERHILSTDVLVRTLWETVVNETAR